MNLHKPKSSGRRIPGTPLPVPHGCEYCYARRFIARFAPHACERPEPEPLEYLPKGSGLFVADTPSRLVDEAGVYVRSTPYPKGFAPTYHTYTLSYPEKRLIPSRVFVSSMGDLFGEWVPDAWIQEVFEACKRRPSTPICFSRRTPSGTVTSPTPGSSLRSRISGMERR